MDHVDAINLVPKLLKSELSSGFFNRLKCLVGREIRLFQSFKFRWKLNYAPEMIVKGRICIKNFGFALRLRTFVQKFLTWGHNPQPQPQTQPSDHGSWICILWSFPRGRSPLRRHRSMQIQDPWSDGCVCGCGRGLCPQVKNFCTKFLNLRAKPKFLMHIRPFVRNWFENDLAISILYPNRKFWRSLYGTNFLEISNSRKTVRMAPILTISLDQTNRSDVS